MFPPSTQITNQNVKREPVDGIKATAQMMASGSDRR
jgi:hypothetical protein